MSFNDSRENQGQEPQFVGNRFSGEFTVDIEGNFPDKIVIYGVQEADLESLLHFDSPIWFALLMTIIGAIMGHAPPTVHSILRWGEIGPTTSDAANAIIMAALISAAVVLIFVVRANWLHRKSIVSRIRSRKTITARGLQL